MECSKIMKSHTLKLNSIVLAEMCGFVVFDQIRYDESPKMMVTQFQLSGFIFKFTNNHKSIPSRQELLSSPSRPREELEQHPQRYGSLFKVERNIIDLSITISNRLFTTNLIVLILI